MPGGPRGENGKKLKLKTCAGHVSELHRRSDLVEISDVSMWVFFIISKQLLVLNKIKKTMLDLKVVCDDFGGKRIAILVTLGGFACFE
ncbi:hypothetical protein Tco_0972755 [Tanacetum coccineum]